MRPELTAAPQPLQVLHVSEQEEDVFAFGMSLEQPAIRRTGGQSSRGDTGSSGGRSHDLINTEAGQLILPHVFFTDLIVPLFSFSCRLQSVCGIRLLFFPFFVSLPSRNHQDCGQMAPLL